MQENRTLARGAADRPQRSLEYQACRRCSLDKLLGSLHAVCIGRFCSCSRPGYGAGTLGIVLNFPDIRRCEPAATAPWSVQSVIDESAIAEAIRSASDQSSALSAARPLLDICRNRYGFSVMQNGLPRQPEALSHILLELYRSLLILDEEMHPPRTYPAFGVYFGYRKLAWFEDGYSGETGLAMPLNTKAAELAAFMRPRVARRSRSHN